MSVFAFRWLRWAALFAAVSGGAPQLTCQTIVHYSRRQVHAMIRQARNAEDYRKIAAYFRIRQEWLEAKAQAEFQEYAHCSKFVINSTKGPNRADSTGALFSYYDSKSQRAAKLAEVFEHRAEYAARLETGHEQGRYPD